MAIAQYGPYDESNIASVLTDLAAVAAANNIFVVPISTKQSYIFVVS